MILKEVIDDLYGAMNSVNSVFGSRVERGSIIRATRKFVKLLTKNNEKQFVRMLEVSPSEDSLTIPFPEDHVDILGMGISVDIKGKGSTYIPLYINRKLNVSSTFLRDVSDELLLDDNSEYLRGVGASINDVNVSTIGLNGSIDNLWY